MEKLHNIALVVSRNHAFTLAVRSILFLEQKRIEHSYYQVKPAIHHISPFAERLSYIHL